MTTFGAQPVVKPKLVPLPPHPAGVPWPTREWPRADLDPRVDRALLDRTLDHAFAEPQPDEFVRTHATIVVQHGAIVVERYAHDAKPEDTFASWSMAKSVTQALVGIAVRQGKLDIHAPADVPEWLEQPNDPRRLITTDQLLRMVDGLRFREAEPQPDGTSRMYDEPNSDVIPMLFGAGKGDVAKFAGTHLPRLHAPEEVWNYNSGGSNLLSRIVGRIVGGGAEGMLQFMHRELFDPIGMQHVAPKFDDAGTFIGSAFCYASARDFARFGTLYLRDGVWDGRRILPEGWVDYTRTPTPQSDQGSYGAHFWIYPGSLGMFLASGFMGQHTIICPRLDLVLVRLGNTPAHLQGNVARYTKAIIDAFRPTARG